jgi:hypothetical protein
MIGGTSWSERVESIRQLLTVKTTRTKRTHCLDPYVYSTYTQQTLGIPTSLMTLFGTTFLTFLHDQWLDESDLLPENYRSGVLAQH